MGILSFIPFPRRIKKSKKNIVKKCKGFENLKICFEKKES